MSIPRERDRMPASILTPDFTARPAPPRPEIGPRRPLATLTSYEVVKQHAAQAKAATAKAAREAVDADGIPRWAQSAHRERYLDSEGELHFKRSPMMTLVRERGVFTDHDLAAIETAAIEYLQSEADVWARAHGRIEHTRSEADALYWQAYYLMHFENMTVDKGYKQTRAARFAVQYNDWIAKLESTPRMDDKGKQLEPSTKLDSFHSRPFALYKLGVTKGRINLLINAAEYVCELRAQLGFDQLVCIARSAEVALADAA